MKFFNKLALSIVSIFLILSCHKEYSLETGNGGSGGGGGLSGYGWYFNAGSANYHGCIDTAYYIISSGVKQLIIEGTDSANNYFVIVVIPQSGKFVPGTYKVSDGVVVMMTDNIGSYVSQPPASLTMQITTINDSLIAGTFNGELTDLINSSSTLNVSSGQFKAMIGKDNPCTRNSRWWHHRRSIRPFRFPRNLFQRTGFRKICKRYRTGSFQPGETGCKCYNPRCMATGIFYLKWNYIFRLWQF